MGRQSVTPVDILYLEGITDPALVKEVQRRVAGIDTDQVFQPSTLEELIVDEVDTAFPLLAYTERPDRFCAGLVEGRVGVIVDGLPLGYLLPGTVGQFFRTGQDRAQNWLAASALSVLRYLCMFCSLFLPAWYVAAVNFHPEMIPARLAWSISEAKLNVPFSTLFEVLIMLLAFEAVQEAGLRLPGPIGQTASILGGLFAVTALSAVLVGRLAQLESFGVPYLAPFAPGQGKDGYGVLRWPTHRVKFREAMLHPRNRRRQG